jgi:uncharacterized RDD family membrane protein YckC
MNQSVRYAGFWIRFLADVIDTLILTAVSWGLEILVLGAFYWIQFSLMPGGGGIESAPEFWDAFSGLFVQVLNVGIYLALSFPYFAYGTFKYGTTLGKRPFGIRVVDAETLGPITLKQSIIRFAGYSLSGILLLAGYLMAAWHPRKQALHDLMAKTVSLRT